MCTFVAGGMQRAFRYLPSSTVSLAVGCLFVNAHATNLKNILLSFLATPYSLYLVSFFTFCPLILGLLQISRKDLLKHSNVESQPQDAEESSPFQPRLFPCQTRHSRLLPKKHSFKYSYLMIGMPIKPSALSSASPVQYHNEKPSHAEPWFDIDAKTHLDRNNKQPCLLDKLNDYLERQGEETSNYAFVYLITAPKFLGYAFNPVSFWYLYDSKRRLTSMILEVNNTFDERRMYLLKGGDVADTGTAIDTPVSSFENTWRKDFHVSPFNSRKGSYALKAIDPFSSLPEADPRIFNVITLSSSKEHPKLVASISSVGPSIDPKQFSTFSKFRFLVVWCWVGFVTYPRIVWQAGKLFFRRNLHVWYRPEVTPTSIGRQSSNYERSIELVFRGWLRSIVEQSTSTSTFRYQPTAIGEHNTIELRSEHVAVQSCNNVDIRPLTPAFYSILVATPTARQYVASVLKVEDPARQMLHTGDRARVDELVSKSEPRPTRQTKSHAPSHETLIMRLQSLLLWILRGFGESELDTFVATSANAELVPQYREAAIKLILAQRVTFGFVEVIDLAIWAVKVTFWWEGIKYCSAALEMGLA